MQYVSEYLNLLYFHNILLLLSGYNIRLIFRHCPKKPAISCESSNSVNKFAKMGPRGGKPGSRSGQGLLRDEFLVAFLAAEEEHPALELNLIGLGFGDITLADGVLNQLLPFFREVLGSLLLRPEGFLDKPVYNPQDDYRSENAPHNYGSVSSRGITFSSCGNVARSCEMVFSSRGCRRSGAMSFNGARTNLRS